MNAETLLQHLYELGVKVGLTPDARSLDLDAPKGVLTPELLELLRENRDDLVQLQYEMEEGEAIAWEGTASLPSTVKLVGDERLLDAFRHHPSVVRLAGVAQKYFGGGTLEISRDEAA
jgi:hypothetical protein